MSRLRSVGCAVVAFAFGCVSNLWAATSAPLDDIVIRVLFVVEDSSLTADAIDMGEHLEQTWSTTNFQGAAGGVSVEVMSPSSPVIYPGSFSGDPDDRRDQLKAYVEQPHPSSPSHTIRAYWGADLVIGLTHNLPSLWGYAPMDNWVKRGFFPDEPEFVPNCVQGCLDLRGADEWYLAIVQANAGEYIAAHEFGHLFGAGHLDTTDTWLTEESHAISFTYYGYSKNVSAVAESNNSFCSRDTVPCNYMPFFSGPGNIGGGTRNNAATLDITATSVANYITGPGPGSSAPPSADPMCSDGFDNDNDGFVDLADPGCTSTSDDDESDDPPPPDAGQGCNGAAYVPVNVTASRLQVCVPGTSATSYRVRWDHACPDLFEIWATQQGAGTYFVGDTFMQSAVLYIEGPPVTGTVNIRSCNTSNFTCSAFSHGVLLVDQC